MSIRFDYVVIQIYHRANTVILYLDRSVADHSLNVMTEPTLVPAPVRVFNRHCLYFVKLVASPK